MKKFIFKTLIYVLFVSLFFAWIIYSKAGYLDPYYVRFTTPIQENLILGTSRAAQGLQPQVFESHLKRTFLNFSFTEAHSPYGPTYLESIKRKLDPNTTDGIFILTIDPWSISSILEDPNDSLNFREVPLCLGNTKNINLKPNFGYLKENFGGNNLLTNFIGSISPVSTLMYLHDDGWLEVTINMDSRLVENRLNRKVDEYRNNHLLNYKFSSTRLKSLLELVVFLNHYGKVYLVRLPVHENILEIENELAPEFNSLLLEVINKSSGFLDLTKKGNDFQFTDGNHLSKKSGAEVSLIISEWVSDYNKK
ncbi:hypothetical protein [Pararhodonellum marinum]|uniref:hypothetical protein n=1 Tax=Pararhodonellum marinum TaxID=2755358 RepID=UPI00188E77EE|nr:hypothetical protein [Pararhodonellum marinum]